MKDKRYKLLIQKNIKFSVILRFCLLEATINIYKENIHSVKETLLFEILTIKSFILTHVHNLLLQFRIFIKALFSLCTFPSTYSKRHI